MFHTWLNSSHQYLSIDVAFVYFRSIFMKRKSAPDLSLTDCNSVSEKTMTISSHQKATLQQARVELERIVCEVRCCNPLFLREPTPSQVAPPPALPPPSPSRIVWGAVGRGDRTHTTTQGTCCYTSCLPSLVFPCVPNTLWGRWKRGPSGTESQTGRKKAKKKVDQAMLSHT